MENGLRERVKGEGRNDGYGDVDLRCRYPRGRGRRIRRPCADLPEVLTFGKTLAEALELAADAIDAIVSWRIEREEDLPLPSPVASGEHPVTLEPGTAARASVCRLWRDANISMDELANRLGRSETDLRRILNANRGAKLDHLQEAAEALGARLVVGFR